MSTSVSRADVWGAGRGTVEDTRFVRVCETHGHILGERLRCPAGHRITPYGGSWVVVDRRSGRVIAVATTEAVTLAESFAASAVKVVERLRDTALPARPRSGARLVG